MLFNFDIKIIERIEFCLITFRKIQIKSNNSFTFILMAYNVRYGSQATV